jgi:hypothetical protein
MKGENETKCLVFALLFCVCEQINSVVGVLSVDERLRAVRAIIEQNGIALMMKRASGYD